MRRLAAFCAYSLLLCTAAQATPYRAELVHDDCGVPLITGRSDSGAFFGLIYAQAEDDFNRIEVNYLTSLGRLADAEPIATARSNAP